MPFMAGKQAFLELLKQEGVDWVSTFPVCRVNNALGREGVPMLMMRDDRYAVAVADEYVSRCDCHPAQHDGKADRARAIAGRRDRQDERNQVPAVESGLPRELG